MKKRKNWFLFGIYILVVIVNLLSRYSVGFGDRVRRSIFQITQYTQGHISSLFPFSVGELLLYLAVFLAVGAVFISCIFAAARAAEQWKKKFFPQKNSGRGIALKGGLCVSEFARRYFMALLWITAVVSVIMSINCFALYHCSSFQENYMPESGREYTTEELALVRDYVVRQCNRLAEEMERDEGGNIIYENDMGKRGIAEMKRLGETYPLLSGYYPTPKTFAFSGFFSQQYIMGYYFPFSMEANYNDVMYIANVPVTICHELSHIKGFIYEDDANFIGYLACVSSEDAFFCYSGYLSVLDYLNRDLYESLGESQEAYLAHEKCSSLVEYDNVFLTGEAWAEVERNAVLDTETVRQASHSFLETNLQVNGVEEGVASYGKVVEQLLAYYDGVLY